MAYIKLCKYKEMTPSIQEKAKPILEKTGKLGEIFELLALDEKIYTATGYFNYINKPSNVFGLGK